jgi:hypothetical protein
VVSFPVHTLRLGRKRPYCAAAPSQFHSDFLRLVQPRNTIGVLLARVGQAPAPPARKEIAAEVKLRNSPSTVRSVGSDRALEPKTPASQMAFRPSKRDSLLYVFPLSNVVTTDAIDQDNSIKRSVLIWMSAARPPLWRHSQPNCRPARSRSLRCKSRTSSDLQDSQVRRAPDMGRAIGCLAGRL